MNTAVSMVLLTYNHEEFVRSAASSVLYQSYSPLEIIFSDDCSSDRSYRILEEMASSYHGPHSIRLRRNVRNLGIAGHINCVMELVSGNLVIVAAGDDISACDRVSRLVAAWKATGCANISLHSGFRKLDVNCSVIDTVIQQKPVKVSREQFLTKNVIVGATHAWTRATFDIFGPLLPNVVHEDRVIGFRSMLLNGLEYIPEPLVDYRVGGVSGQESGISAWSSRRRNSRRYLIDCAQALSDIAVANKYGLINDVEELRLQCAAVERASKEIALLRADNLYGLARSILSDFRSLASRIAFVCYKLFSK